MIISGAPEQEAGDAENVTLANALAKARAVHGRVAGAAVLACDTVVTLDGQLHGKPADERAARRTLQTLAGRTHEVVSAIALVRDGREQSACERTAVSFRELDGGLLDWYLARGEWRGRAGGYAIQGAGAALVRAVRGDYENVVGLPLARLLDLWPELLAR